ncbi:MAG: GatB/YqeY domain-containing protein [Rickettsiales bacterium]|jgi:uncharacterized protein YqeY|nr:GatB/YqeY domain-containing protein [Rickettsiales bacterium]
MSKLLEIIDDDFKNAMKQKLESAKLTLSTLKSNVKYKMLDLRAKGKELTDGDVLNVIESMIKKGRESAEQFLTGNRKDLSDKELEQINIISKYLPKQLNEKELKDVIEAEVKLQKFEKVSDMGAVMSFLKQNFSNRYDAKLASDIIKSILK